MQNKLFTFIFGVLLTCNAMGQKIDPLASFRSIDSETYFRFHYDNDYFTSSDQNYTQGYSFEFVLKSLEKNPVNVLLLNVPNSSKQYGLSLDHIGFTPNNIGSPNIQEGDRPFASAIMLKSFQINTDTVHRMRLISAVRLGLIGPGAFGKEMQVAIHEQTGNTIPQGWQNQIKNDVVANYQVTLQKQLVSFSNYFSLQVEGSLNVGTLSTNASTGVVAMLGLFNNPFTTTKKRGFQVYVYSQPTVTFVGYDATLQGGLFNRKSPYTIASSDMERFVGQHNFGLVVQTKTLYFEYTSSDITREFSTGPSAAWGGIKIGFTF